VLYSFVLLGMLRLYVILENPLGEDKSDFPIATYLRTFQYNVLHVRDNGLAAIANPTGIGKTAATECV
jgi:predicted membrane chloride channel (bestrophin family)